MRIVNFSYMEDPGLPFPGSGQLMSTAYGTGLGGVLGTVYGGVKAAQYDPDLIDPKTKKPRKLTALERAALVAGGMNTGYTVGSVLGGGLGKAGYDMVPQVRRLADNESRRFYGQN